MTRVSFVLLALLVVPPVARAQEQVPAAPPQQLASAQPQTASAPQPAQTTAPAPAAAQLQPAPRPPFPNRANTVMPSWLRVRGEFRERVEGFENSGFTADRDDSFALSRVRLNATITARRVCRFKPTCRTRASPGNRSGRRQRRSTGRSICAWRSPTSATRKRRLRRGSGDRSSPSANSVSSAMLAG